jgi:hypothetical protein
MKLTMLALATLVALPLVAAERNGVSMQVEINDEARPEYHGRGNTYIEGLRGKPYQIRLTNPTGNRVAVALSVDGLNTIDAKHTDAWNASKWVLDPYESTVIEGWQVSGTTARQFFFTGESRSYGAALGQTENLGIIQAVFYREQPRYIEYSNEETRDMSSPRPPSAGASAPSRERQQKAEALDDDAAATGMGRRRRHDVTSVAIDLDPSAIASISLRYEFRPQLVKLGIIPDRNVLDRRERAKGFEYCPQVN